MAVPGAVVQSAVQEAVQKIAGVTLLRDLEHRERSVSWPGESRPSPLRELLPASGLKQGNTVTVTGSTSLALMAASTAKGGWCAAVNFGDLGLVAAAEAGLDLEKFALVPRARDKWPQVTAALIDAFDVVLLSLKEMAPPKLADTRRLASRARERNTVLIPVLDDARLWPQADLRLSCNEIKWHGIENGRGHLDKPELRVSVGGRGAAAQVKHGYIQPVAS